MSNGADEEVKIARAIMKAFRVRRYHVKDVIHDETVGEHTAGVIAFCLVLTQGTASRSLLIHALFHDFAEQHTGDLPHPFKRDNPNIKLLVQEAEDKFMANLGVELPVLEDADAVLLKAADMLQLCFKAKREMEMGNSLARGTLDNGIRQLHGLQCMIAQPWGQTLSNLIKEVTA